MIAEADPPKRNQETITTPAHAEYSVRLAPSHTGDQYRQYDKRNGAPNAATQRATTLVIRAHTKASAIETPTIMKAPETKDSDSISSSISECKFIVIKSLSPAPPRKATISRIAKGSSTFS